MKRGTRTPNSGLLMKSLLVAFCSVCVFLSAEAASVTYPLPEVGGLDFVRADSVSSALAAAEAEMARPVEKRRIVAAPKDGALAAKKRFPELKVCLVTTSAKRHDARAVRDAEAFAAVAAHMDYLEFDKDYPDDVAAAVHDAGVKAISRCRCTAEDLQAATELGAKHVITEDPEKAARLLGELAKRQTGPVTNAEFRIRDPFILPIKEKGVYCLYGTVPWNVARGIEVRTSTDLKHWSAPHRVMTMPSSFNTFRVVAPEVHVHKGKYYLFATVILYPDPQHPIKSMAEDPSFAPPICFPLTRSGTWIWRSDSPDGPFEMLSDMSATPHEFMALDGTLVKDPDGSPWMVYCHEWTQTQIGRMEVGRLKDDLSGLAGPIKELFRADSACGPDRVTDGPFCYRSPRTAKLSMIWSKFCDGGYSVISCSSESGRAEGPWSDFKIMFAGNGGHGMIFRTFEGDLKLVMHKPEIRGHERLAFFPIVENEDGSLSMAVHK